MAELPLTGENLRKAALEYHAKFGHVIVEIQHISLISRTDICYATCCIVTQTVAPTLPCFQGIKQCVQYLASHTHKSIIYSSNSYDG